MQAAMHVVEPAAMATAGLLGNAGCDERATRTSTARICCAIDHSLPVCRSLHFRGPSKGGWPSRHRRGGSGRGTSREAMQSPSSSSSGGGPKEDGLVELPLFPLPLVLFPGAVLPLQIFEYRYRIMMHTLLQTDLRFGVVFAGKETGGTAAAIGCVGEVVKHEKLVDDRYFLVCRGQERFRVVDIVRSRPYMVGKVAFLEDRPSPQQPGADVPDTETLSNEVELLMKDVIRLANKMSGDVEAEAPADLRKSAFPTPFSFWVASTFDGAPSEQQALLELVDTNERLQRERETLRNTLNYLTAAAAVKDVFSSPSE